MSSCSFWLIILISLLSRYLDDRSNGIACVVVGAVLALCAATTYRARRDRKVGK